MGQRGVGRVIRWRNTWQTIIGPFLAGAQPGAERELIILADDNADMRRYLARLLADRYDVRAVADGRQVLEAIQELRPALVLTDIMMLHLDGFCLLRAIRDDSALAGTPVILLSARAREESRVPGTAGRGRDDYLVKPFTARELLASEGGATPQNDGFGRRARLW